MKLRLDEKELANIAMEWARKTYKTKNVSALYGIDIDAGNLRALYLDLEIVLSEAEQTETSAETAEAIKRVQGIMGSSASYSAEPDLSGPPL